MKKRLVLQKIDATNESMFSSNTSIEIYNARITCKQFEKLRTQVIHALRSYGIAQNISVEKADSILFKCLDERAKEEIMWYREEQRDINVQEMLKK